MTTELNQQVAFYTPKPEGGHILLYGETQLPKGFTMGELSDMYERKEPIPYLKNTESPIELKTLETSIKELNLSPEKLKHAIEKLELDPSKF